MISFQETNLPTDLALRYHQSIDLIYEKVNIYHETAHSIYPPSTFLFISALSLNINYYNMDEVWAFINIVSLISLSAIIYFFLKNYKCKWILILSVLSLHSIPHALGVGQISIVFISFFLLSIYMIIYHRNNYILIFGTLLLTISLGKFSLFLPFIPLLVINNKLRYPTLVSIAINFTLSYAILYRVDSNIYEYVASLASSSSEIKALGSLDLNAFLSLINAPDYLNTVGPVAVLLLAAVITIHYRERVNLFPLLALMAIVSRLFIYHNHYDNFILVIPLVYIFKFYWNYSDKNYAILYFLFLVSLIIPARFLVWSEPIYGITLIYQLIIWLLTAVIIFNHLHESKSQKRINYYTGIQ